MSIKSMSSVLIVGLAVAAAGTAMAQQRGQAAGQSSRATGAAGAAGASADRERAADRLQDRDVGRDTDRTRDRDATRDTLHLQDRDRLQDSDVFGSALMTPQELSQYKDRLRNAKTDAEWARIRARHEEQMQARARQSGGSLQAPVYGQFMMTAREQQRYRQRVESARNLRRQAKIRAQNQSAMQQRAKRLGVQLPPPVYGQQLMTAEEQARYRARLQSMSNEAGRQQLMAEHREQMQARARENRIPLDELGD
jgi:hypothetical protein